jgi:diadenosine tetraphosphate (Ap4A) HIT family hydrolase
LPNATLLKFGYPKNLIRDHDRWAVLLRPQQVTLGCLVLACKEEATRMSDVSREAFAALPDVTREIEQALSALFQYDKINYLALMMVDRNVHFHVIPRYAAPRAFLGLETADPGWPRYPDLEFRIAFTDEQFAALRSALAQSWPAPEPR